MDRRRRPRPRPRLPRGRREAFGIVIALLAIAGLLLPGAAFGARDDAPRPDDPGRDAGRLGAFLWGLAGEESGWDWTARNSTSGAYGRYQVMPQNWPSWAGRYLGDRFADPSPRNQALVVRRKVADLFTWLGSWRRVAYWWLTGDTETREKRWSRVARGYVDDVMALAGRAPAGGDPIPPAPAAREPVAERGDWRYVVGDDVQLLDRADGEKRLIADLRDGQVLYVQGARRNSGGVLWLRVSTAGDLIGWVSLRRTVPASRPDEARRWPRTGHVSHPQGGGPDGDRERARPRPR